MHLSFGCGAMGMAWNAACAAQQVVQVFFRNHLGATDSQLGLLVAAASLTAPLHLIAIFIYGRLRTRKAFWVTSHILHRALGYVLAGVAVYAARGGDMPTAVRIMLGATAVSFALATISVAGWWSWIADLVPEHIRGTFFGRRSAVIHFTNMLWFFGIQASLDYLKTADTLYVYAVVFGLGGTLGILDIVLHALIPEPRRDPAEPRLGWRAFVEPLRTWNFLRFSLAIGLFSFSTSIFGPFVAPYITADVERGGIGAANTWLGIMYVISQVIWIATVPAWGILMDRFGPRPVVILGALFPVSWIGYLLLTPTNYAYVLPAVALVGGLLSPGYWNGIGQMMLTLTPQHNRTAFIAWHSVVVGLIAAGGAILGGQLKDAVSGFSAEAWGIRIGSFHVVAMVSLALLAPSVLLLGRIRKGREPPVGFVVSRLATPGVFRTFRNLSIIAGRSSSSRTARALRMMDGASSHVATADVLKRLDDPDPEVREEAGRALGRIGSYDAVEALAERLGDADSTIRPVIARSLGRIGDPRAVPALIEALSSGSEDVEEAAAQALGEIGGRTSRRRLQQMLGERRTERVFVSGVEAVSKHGILEAVMDIVPRMHETTNPVLRGQLAIAIGNLLGEPGGFYPYLTGETAHQGARLGRLFRRSRKAIQSFRSITTTADRTCLKEIERDLIRLRGLMEGQSYRPVLEALASHVRTLVRLMIGRQCPDEVALEYAFGRDVKLGLGFWFIQEVRRRMGAVADEQLLHTNALLALYFLSVYRLPPDPPLRPS